LDLVSTETSLGTQEMNKSELVRAVAEASGKPITVVDAVLAAVFNEITSALGRGETISIGGFGSFALSAKPAKKKTK